VKALSQNATEYLLVKARKQKTILARLTVLANENNTKFLNLF
jgi:hypothetical protein